MSILPGAGPSLGSSGQVVVLAPERMFLVGSVANLVCRQGYLARG